MAYCMSCGIELPDGEGCCQTCYELDQYFAQKIKEADEDIANGNVVSQEEFFKRFEDMITHK